jgi:hypothetical protein
MTKKPKKEKYDPTTFVPDVTVIKNVLGEKTVTLSNAFTEEDVVEKPEEPKLDMSFMNRFDKTDILDTDMCKNILALTFKKNPTYLRTLIKNVDILDMFQYEIDASLEKNWKRTAKKTLEGRYNERFFELKTSNGKVIARIISSKDDKTLFDVKIKDGEEQ